MAAINGYIDRRSEEKKASGKVWEEAGGLYTGENGELLQTVQIYTLLMHNVQYILRGNCGRGREKGCTEEKEAGEAEERERVERGRRGREEREEEWEGGEGQRRSREERKGGEGGRSDRR